MKKKLFTSIACAVMALVGTVALAACGTPADVRFERVKGYYMDQDLDIAATRWTKVSTEEKYKEEGVDEVYKINDQTLKFNENAEKATESAYVVCVTFTGKNDIDKAEFKLGTTKENMDVVENKKTTNEAGEETKEKDWHLFIKIEKGTEGKNVAKTVYVSIDWDKEGTEFEAVVYKLVIEEGTLTLQEKAAA